MTLQRLLARRALAGIETLPPADRADVYEAVALIMNSVHPEESAEAYRIANAIRESESSQLKFTALLLSAQEQNS